MYTRRSRRLTAWTAVIALLLMQVAVAGYTCPYMDMMRGGESMIPAECANGIVRGDRPNLCEAHGNVHSQLKGDQASAPLAVPAVLTAALVPIETADGLRAARSESYALSRLLPDGSPPIFVRHRVFRK